MLPFFRREKTSDAQSPKQRYASWISLRDVIKKGRLIWSSVRQKSTLFME
uniref:Uncharacterized protein n=1 Tax=Leptospirillum sp. Group II '5-way CG' TaxID=419541 RepID=B6ANL6_9BACT|nr:MAG: Hypothetical protein CGL2_11276195 [Leptospirillum sp. Group II '5-way CG']